MKFLKKIGDKEKEALKLFLAILAVTTVILGWCYVAFLLILGALDFDLVFDLKFLLGVSMIVSAFVFVCSLDDKN